MLFTSAPPFSTLFAPDSGFDPLAAAPSPAAVVGDTIPHAFARLVSLYQSNDCLLSVLDSLKDKLIRARAYAESPGSHTGLARANLLRLKARHSAALTLLRVNRVQARNLLTSLEPVTEETSDRSSVT